MKLREFLDKCEIENYYVNVYGKGVGEVATGFMIEDYYWHQGYADGKGLLEHLLDCDVFDYSVEEEWQDISEPNYELFIEVELNEEVREWLKKECLAKK